MSEPAGHPHHSGCSPDHGSAPTTLDPVCGMSVDPAKTPHHAAHDGREFHFCSAGCWTKFLAEPAKYLSVEKPPASAAPVGTISAVQFCAPSPSAV